MSGLGTSPRSSRNEPPPPHPSASQTPVPSSAPHLSSTHEATKIDPSSPRYARSTFPSQPNLPQSPSTAGPVPKSSRSNIHDILSSDSQPSAKYCLKRPYPESDPASNPAPSEPALKRSRESSPSRYPVLSPAYAVGQHQPPAYAIAGSANAHKPSLAAGSDDQTLSRKVSHEGSQDEGRGSVSDGSGDPDSSPSSSHHPDRDPGYNTSKPPSAMVQQIQQERPPKKRNFANRTKTGCLTCRERKKKCDEGKPFCKNCERGGFRCKGYAQPGSTFRRSALSLDQQAAIASASAQPVERAASPASIPQPYPHQPSPGYPHQPRGPYTPRSEEESRLAMRGEPIYDTRHVRTASTAEAGPIYAPLQNQTPLPPQHYTPRQPTRPGTDIYPPEPPRPSEQYPRYPPQPPQPPPANDPAYLPHLSHANKDNMLRSWPYDQNDPTLRAERLECKRTCARFNTFAESGTPHHDPVWRDHAIAIFEPRRRRASTISSSSPHSQSQSHSHRLSNPATYTFPSEPLTPVYPGHLGENVRIDATFTAEYGYNIRLADNVDVKGNVYIDDSALVEIGAGSTIARDVMILTAEPEPYIPGQRMLYKSRRVVIGEGCYIGPRAVILPGTTLPPGTRVRPGAVVPEAVLVAAGPPPPPGPGAPVVGGPMLGR